MIENQHLALEFGMDHDAYTSSLFMVHSDHNAIEIFSILIQCLNDVSS